MTSPFTTYPAPDRAFVSANPAARPALTPTPTPTTAPSKNVSSKRGRKPKGTAPSSTTTSPRVPSGSLPADGQTTNLQWTNVTPSGSGTTTFNVPFHPNSSQEDEQSQPDPNSVVLTLPGENAAGPSRDGPTTGATPGAPVPGGQGAEDDGEGEDEMLPAMADDDYSAQLSFQSQSKDNLKVLMDNFSPAQYDRFEAYRRHALPKQAVRKVIQQTLGQQVSQPVAQVVAGFAKVFVGEIVEKARAVQQTRGDTGPVSPDHLREAYRLYQLETGRIGAARPHKSKRLFVR